MYHWLLHPLTQKMQCNFSRNLFDLTGYKLHNLNKPLTTEATMLGNDRLQKPKIKVIFFQVLLKYSNMRFAFPLSDNLQLKYFISTLEEARHWIYP